MNTERIISFITGKNKQEREYEAQKHKEIKQASREAYLDARKEQEITLARQRAVFEREAKVAKLKAYYKRKATPMFFARRINYNPIQGYETKAPAFQVHDMIYGKSIKSKKLKQYKVI